MKHTNTTQKISKLIEQVHELQELDIPQSAIDHLEDAVCELQQAIDELDKDEGSTH
jgi:prefoldin subunit 5